MINLAEKLIWPHLHN